MRGVGSRRSRLLIACSVAAAPLVAGASSFATTAPVTEAQRPSETIRVFERHALLTSEQGMDHPDGATYLPSLDLIAVAEREGAGSAVTLLAPASGDVARRMTVPRLMTPEILASDGRGRLAAFDGKTLITWSASARGTATVIAHEVQGEPVARPAGMTYDPATRQWLVLDAEARRVFALQEQAGTVRVSPGRSLNGVGDGGLRGIALDSTSGLLYVAEPAASLVHVISADGSSRRLDLRDVSVDSMKSLFIGRTADPSDGRDEMSLYVVDAGSETTYGRVAEVSLTVMGAGATSAPLTSTATLVRKSLLSQLTPPSPDSSGIVYMSDLDRLFVADSEVEEMTIYQGVNLWQLSRDAGTTHSTGTTLKFSKEPTGISYDPVRKRAFISDDSKRRVFEVTAGTDKRFGTSDDVTRYFSTLAFGLDDPEDVAYDTTTGDLFVAGGLARDVWHVRPGHNGVFDGVAPTGDDTVSRFDTGAFGTIDLEGIGYSPVRNSLFLVDAKFTKILEVTTTGSLVQSIDVAGIKMLNPAGITLAPATDDPTRTSLYVVTRGVDNNKDPNENDGTMYELSAPYLGSPTPPGPSNQAPVVDAGPDKTVQLPAQAALDGTATDDGLPNPPGTLTVSWAQVSGPGTVTFDNAASAATGATFSAAGTYVLRLSGNDSVLTTSDELTVVVNDAGPTNLVGNSGFEVDLSGWKGSTGTTLERVATPYSGSWSARLTNTGTTSTTCQLNDSPNWIPTTTAGTYTASAWVRSNTGGGSTIRIRLREYAASTLVGTAEGSVTSSTTWQKLTVTYTPTSPGSSTLDLNVMRSSTPAGTVCFLTDDVHASVS